MNHSRNLQRTDNVLGNSREEIQQSERERERERHFSSSRVFIIPKRTSRCCPAFREGTDSAGKQPLINDSRLNYRKAEDVAL